MCREIAFSPPDIHNDEIDAIIKVLKSGWITTGPKTKEFERKIASYVGVKRAVCLNSATAAMEMSLRILGVGPGDEVITSAYTYTASASVIEHVGADIVLIDTSRDSFEMDYRKLEDSINERTKVIIPVDIGGRICDYEKIHEIVEAKKNIYVPNNDIQKRFGKIVVMADAAHSFGAKRNGKNSGQLADISCFSFHAVKNLTTAEGGAVVWNNDYGLGDDWIYQQFMLYSLHGQSKDALAKTTLGSWEYDIIYPAYKCNMTDVLAAIGLSQLGRYEQMLARRREIVERYDDGLRSFGVTSMQHFGDKLSSSCHLYLARIPDIEEKERNNLIVRMAELGIATNVHYKPLPMFTAYKNLGFNISDYPNAFGMYENEISLPLHTRLTNDDIDYVIDSLKKSLSR